MLRPLTGRFSGDDREGLNGLSCVRGDGFRECHPHPTGGSSQTSPTAGKGRFGFRNGGSAPPGFSLGVFAGGSHGTVTPRAEPQAAGDQPLPRADLLFPGELQALPQPSQGIIRGNLSPSPALTTLAPCSGLFPLWNHSKHCCNACPHPRDPSGTLWDSGAGESRPLLGLAVPLRGGNCFQRMGVTRTGLSHPSHPALIGYPASEAKE